MKVILFIGACIVGAVVALQAAAIILPIVGVGFMIWMAYSMIKTEVKTWRR